MGSTQALRAVPGSAREENRDVVNSTHWGLYLFLSSDSSQHPTEPAARGRRVCGVRGVKGVLFRCQRRFLFAKFLMQTTEKRLCDSQLQRGMGGIVNVKPSEKVASLSKVQRYSMYTRTSIVM